MRDAALMREIKALWWACMAHLERLGRKFALASKEEAPARLKSAG